MNKDVLSEFDCKPLGLLKNRVVMSAMTRGFADKDHCCTDLMADYYIRRAENGVGVILTEGIVIHPSADGYNNVPHMATTQQAESWRKAIKGVHKFDSKIVAQLWHCGRISHSDYTEGKPPASSTNVAAEGINRQNNKPYGEPKALTPTEINEVIELHVSSADKALKVGFDAVQIHMGHGYLIDQFFDSRINDRTDSYGGSVENRCRFALDLVRRLIDAFGAEKIMIRISPSRFMGGIYEWPNLDEMLEYFIGELKVIGLQMIDISCANADYFETSGKVIKKVRQLGWTGTIVGGASLTLEQANSLVSESDLDLVTWGRNILANPDFVEKMTNGDELLVMTDEIRNTLY